MNPLEAINRLRQITTPPENIETASPTERGQRALWQIASTIVAFVLAAIPAALLSSYLPSEAIIPNLLLLLGTIVLWLYLDVYYIFPWGVDRLGIVVPWQFRVTDEQLEPIELSDWTAWLLLLGLIGLAVVTIAPALLTGGVRI